LIREICRGSSWIDINGDEYVDVWIALDGGRLLSEDCAGYGAGLHSTPSLAWSPRRNSMRILHTRIGRRAGHILLNGGFWWGMIIITFPQPAHIERNVSAISIDDREKLVREFVEAFNTRKIEKMLELADENIQWLIIDGIKISVETEGKKALRDSMEKYFRDCPTCKSSLEWVQIAGSRVTAKEKASWMSKNGPREQSSLSVYEFRNGKILRVYYFPVDIEPGNK
jgi:ketosteroid isomerase-like protein